ncbi:MAG TPA: VWA domain-containing protein [Polyangiaceae bacterium]|nr:VWA domain-containing protein [Polyangiaceae bacterium]
MAPSSIRRSPPASRNKKSFVNALGSVTLLTAAAWVAALAGACSSDADSAGSPSTTTTTTATSRIPTSNSNPNGAAAGNSGLTPGSGCGESTPGACAGVSFEGERIPVDLYIMFDQSGSMLNDVGGMTRLDAVRQAVTTFLRDSGGAAIGVGIGYFGTQPIGQVSCNAADYSRPAVPVSLNHELVIQSVSGREPTGETPTAAALTGACGYVSEYARSNPGRAAAILLVTDGTPEAPVSCSQGGCCPTLDQAADAASSCAAGKTPIPTYVLGVGPNLDGLHRIAAAGGTERAYLVDDRDVANSVLQALLQIRGAAQIPCDIEIPEPDPGLTLDYSKINVLSSATSCAVQPFYYVESAADCGHELAWHYDNNAAPSRIQLCSQACEAVNQPSTRLRVLLGCESVELPPR